MAIYRIKDDQGNSFKIEGPEDATDDELQQAIQSHTQTGPDLAKLQAEDQPVQPQFGFEGPATTARQGMEGIGGLLASGGDLQQASQIAQGGPATTKGGKVGKFIGSMAGPIEVGMAAAGNEALKPIFKGVGAAYSKLKQIGKVATAPGEVAQTIARDEMIAKSLEPVSKAKTALSESKQIPEALTSVKQEISSVPSRMKNLTLQREQLVSKAGKNIGELEKDLGPLDSEKIANLVRNPAKASSRLQKLTNIASKGPEHVAENMTPAEIRINRQFLQEVSKNPEVSLQFPQASQANATFGKAMNIHKPGYENALDLYKATQQALDDVPRVASEEISQLRSQAKSLADAFANKKLSSAEAVKTAEADAKLVMQKANALVNQGKLSDVYRSRIYKALIGTGASALGLKGASYLRHQ